MNLVKFGSGSGDDVVSRVFVLGLFSTEQNQMFILESIIGAISERVSVK